MVQGTRIFSDSSWKRANELWAHVEQILSRPATEFERSNAIRDLRLAIDRRILILGERYSFKTLPIKNKPTDPLELLGFLGIVRPRMLQKLIAIRNAVEHEDAEPPDDEACQVYLEFTWYFLRSTDFIVQKIVDNILFGEDSEGGYWVEVGIRPPANWIPTVRGWVPANFVSLASQHNWLSLNVDRCESYQDQIKGLRQEGMRVSKEHLALRKADDVFISAEVRGSGEVLRKIYKVYFEIP
jgi:hypothetical protein